MTQISTWINSFFQLKTDRDTVIESDNGIVIYVPAYAFDTENDEVEFLLQEALSPEDIMYAGLNTMTLEGDTLETGGMFYFDAFVNDERVKLNEELLVDIPADPEKTGMELYEGVENNAGELLWTDPKPLAKPLIPTEITELDFYPKGYEPKMEEWGYFNKAFKDSLYYSFAVECFDEREAAPVISENYEIGKMLFNGNCASCHFPDRDMTGPALLGARERWINNSSEENFYRYIKNSMQVMDEGDNYAKRLFEQWDATVMTPQNLTNEQIDFVFDYVESFGNRTLEDASLQ